MSKIIFEKRILNFFNSKWCKWLLSGIKGLPVFINLTIKSLLISKIGIMKANKATNKSNWNFKFCWLFKNINSKTITKLSIFTPPLPKNDKFLKLKYRKIKREHEIKILNINKK